MRRAPDGGWSLELNPDTLNKYGIGLEDVLVLPDGTRAPDNAALVAAARELTATRH